MTFGMLVAMALKAAQRDLQERGLSPVFMVTTPTDPAAVERINAYLEEVRSSANFHQVVVLESDVQVDVKQGCQHLNPEESEVTLSDGGKTALGWPIVLVKMECAGCGLELTSEVLVDPELFD